MLTSDPETGVLKRKKNGRVELPSTFANVLRGMGILCALVAVAFLVSKIVMGAVFLHRCSLEPMLPVLLLVSGVVPLALLPFPFCQIRSQGEQPPSLRSRIASALLLLLLLFLLCWLLTNVVYVFRARAFVRNRPCNSSNWTVAALPFDSAEPLPTSITLPTTIAMATSTTIAMATSTTIAKATSTPIAMATSTTIAMAATSTSALAATTTSATQGTAVSTSPTLTTPGTPCLTCHAAFWEFCYAVAILDLLFLSTVLVTAVVGACLSFGTVCLATLLCEGR